MTQTDAVTVLRIFCEADGGCEHCAANLFEEFLIIYPEYKLEAREVWKEKFTLSFAPKVLKEIL